MDIWEQVTLIFLYVTIGGYVVLALMLLVHGYFQLTRPEDLIKAVRRSSAGDRPSVHAPKHFRKRGWANTWLPRNLELNLSANMKG
jgi:hypothetical protein